MSVPCSRALAAVRAPTASTAHRASIAALARRPAPRRLLSASSAASSPASARRTAFKPATAAVAGCCAAAAAVSLLAVAALGSASGAAESDDGSQPADGLSPAPTPAPVGALSGADGAAKHTIQAAQTQQAGPPQRDTYTHADVGSGASGADQPHAAPPQREGGKPHLVILGSGWGAVSLLKGLDRDAYEVTVISPRNYFLFTPLLPSATTGQVETRTLMEPIRRICHRIGAHYFEGKAVDVDCDGRTVRCRGYNGHDFSVPYDHLVLAVGAKNNTFGVDGADDYTYFLKEVRHARKIRHKLLSLLEEASLPGLSRDERERLLHFVVVGGGPTGVEFAGEFHDLLTDEIRTLFPDLTQHVSLSLIQSQDHILNTYDAKISEVAEKQFRTLDINLITGARVLQVKPNAVVYKDKRTQQTLELPFGMCVWSTGIDAVQLTRTLQQRLSDAQDTKSKVLATDSRLRVRGRGTDGRVYAVGDCASVTLPRDVSGEGRLQSLFAATDSDGDARLSQSEFGDLLEAACADSPFLSATLRAEDPQRLFHKYDKNGDGGIDVAEFRQLVEDMSRTKAFPATAQVASQQGEYLAARFNGLARHKADSAADAPFNYCHMGQLAYIGGESAAVDLGGGHNISGWGAYWLWKGVYFSTSVSARTRMLLLSNWIRTTVFGRDVSKQ